MFYFTLVLILETHVDRRGLCGAMVGHDTSDATHAAPVSLRLLSYISSEPQFCHLKWPMKFGLKLQFSFYLKHFSTQ